MSNASPKAIESALRDHFEDRHDCQVVSLTADRIELTDIPESGGAHMLPGSFGTLEKLGEHWDEWEIEYVPNGKTIRCGRRDDKNVVITRQ